MNNALAKSNTFEKISTFSSRFVGVIYKICPLLQTRALPWFGRIRRKEN